MSVDGFSMANIGLTTELSAAQVASNAEHLAKKESEIKVKDPEEAEKDQGVKHKTEQEEQEEHEFQDGFKKQQESEEDENHVSEKDIKKDPKEFSIRINSGNDKVELLNNKSGKVVESMKASELMGVLSKLDNASGILVNKKI